MTRCAVCLIISKSSDDKFYDIRFTKTGKYGDEYIEHKDIILCDTCFKTWIITNLYYLQSARRIENPLNAIMEDAV